MGGHYGKFKSGDETVLDYPMPKAIAKRTVYKHKNRLLKGNNFFYAISLLAQRKTLKEVQDELKKNQNINVSIMALSRLYAENKDLIDQEEQKIMAVQCGAPIGIEKVRLERDEALYQLSQQLPPKDIRGKVSLGLACLKEAREETKGSGNSGNTYQFNQFNELSNKELLDKIRKVKLEIVELEKREGEVYAKG